MLKRHKPEVGCWYEDKEQGNLFKVVAVEDTDFIAIQHFHGEIDELDIETFLKLPFRIAEPPEDWSGPFEIENGIIDPEANTEPVEHWQQFEEHDEDNLSITDQL